MQIQEFDIDKNSAKLYRWKFKSAGPSINIKIGCDGHGRFEKLFRQASAGRSSPNTLPKVELGHSIRGPCRPAAAHIRAPVLFTENRRKESKVGGVNTPKALASLAPSSLAPVSRWCTAPQARMAQFMEYVHRTVLNKANRKPFGMPLKPMTVLLSH